MSVAIHVSVNGRVQGVGFRPFIFALADQYHILGTVQNNMDGVKIHAESTDESILDSFVNDIKTKAPRLSKISEIYHQAVPFQGFQEFLIIPSDPTGNSSLVIPIDAAVCDDCLSEMNDPNNFRFQYPFINCTQCGPRYTIIDRLPYDRPVTSMHSFPMCDDCAKEYLDPMNRRHHAQPIACPKCGPRLTLIDITGQSVPGDPVAETRRLIQAGKIVAIKGLGGYHLCCDATNDDAVTCLRERKDRPKRPLAIMASSVKTAKLIAWMNSFEESIFSSPESPIILLEINVEGIAAISPIVAPDMNKIGIMLPYTPLHHLLLDDQELPFIVATSANPSGLPILYEDSKATDYLSSIADYILLHNREILHPIDDSVVECNEYDISIIRRSRGFAPDPISASINVDGMVAFGGQMKNTFAIGREKQIIIGPHIGEMNHLEMEEHFSKELNHLLTWTNIEKKIAVIDMHPLYATRNIAKSYRFNQVIEVQHHHAHMAGCMEENQIDEDCYGIILDGTGYGLDGKIWGFEIFEGNKQTFSRIAHLAYSPLPGGDKAIQEPWRNATGLLISMFSDNGVSIAKQLFPSKMKQIEIINEMIKQGVNSPLAGTCGRLYDAVAAILGFCEISTYDGEAAIHLSENAVDSGSAYPFEWRNNELCLQEMIMEIILDKEQGVPTTLIAGKFQRTIVTAIVDKMAQLLPKKVVLSGGSFHNQFLLNQVKIELKKLKFDVFHHSQVPTGDGGLAFGQMIVAASQLQ